MSKRKDGLCRKCLAANANTSGYCYPCRTALRKGKLCIKCKASEQSPRGGGYCSKCSYENQATSKVCWKCKGEKTIRGVICTKCERDRRANAKKCLCCGSLEPLKHGRCLDCRKRHSKTYRQRKAEKFCGKACKCGRGIAGRNGTCAECNRDKRNRYPAIYHKCIDCGSEKRATTTKRCGDCFKPVSVRHRSSRLAKKYKTDQSTILRLWSSTRCDICLKEGIDPNIDHCHETGRLRGVLCTMCNFALGQFRDNTKFIHNAIGYINNARSLVPLDIHVACNCGGVRRGDSLTCQKCKNRYRKNKCSLCEAQSHKHGVCIACKRLREKAVKFDVTIHEARRLDAVEQCEICQKRFDDKKFLDHCHSTGIVRGVLCSACNAAIGMMRDNEIYMTNAIKYLEFHKARLVI